MTPPLATYRLQFRDGMTFGRAAGLARYLAQLGISHLYASPLFAAVPGSAHGYDGIDFSRMEPEIGGEDGFERLCDALADARLGLLLDFVPNHMAAAESNPWWRSVLEWGVDSPYGRYFDIDWTAPKLALPVLGTSYEEALADGTFRVAFDAACGRFTFVCYDRHLPLTPPSYGTLLGRTGDAALVALGRRFRSAGVGDAAALSRRLAELADGPRAAAALDGALADLNGNPAGLHEIHQLQPWRLMHWRRAREALTYRRFFEIAGLVCLRVEDPEVFDAVHARLFDLIGAGRVGGVRLDHIDGLADPKAYLGRLQAAASDGRPVYLLVEKILEGDECLRSDWPVAGTTGYEFIAALSRLFVDPRRETAMSAAYADFTKTAPDYAADARALRREILAHNLAAELASLSGRARALAAARDAIRHLGAEAIRRAVIELAAALPVYRTYVADGSADETDRDLIAGAAAEARRTGSAETAEAVDFVAGLILCDRTAAECSAAAEFRIRFQQTTGPVMAKAIEDTLYYRFNRLVALNEVGGAPDRYGGSRTDFHAAMSDRLARQPAGLSATATHDTKRGEDARARIYVLSEMPERWREAVGRWAAMNGRHRARLAAGPAPEPAMEWLFYQTLAGAWPAALMEGSPARAFGPGLSTLRSRLRAYMEKATREAKLRTNWTDPDSDYEAAVSGFVDAVLSEETGHRFLEDFRRACGPVWRAGAVNALAQLAIKLVAPGVPDIYQGTELWDFSLVDPDNRSPVDFAVRRKLLEQVERGADPEALLEDWTSGMPKMALMSAGLRLRAERPALFAEGDYFPLGTAGAQSRQIVAFARTRRDALAVLVAPRLVLGLMEGAERPLVPPGRWGDTAVVLPERLPRRPLRDIVTGTVHDAADEIPVARILARFPVAVLVDG